MANLFNDVRPGDLILANLWNQVLHTLQSHEDRLNALAGATSGSGLPQITSFSPSSNIHVQDEFRVFGQNFGLPGSNVVTIDDTRIDSLEAGSNDGLLTFKIPPIVVPVTGKTVTLSVTTSQGSATTSFTLLPALVTVPTGQLLVSLTAPANTTFAAGQSFTLTYTVTATTTLDDSYDLLPSADASGWQASIVDSAGAVIPGPTIFIRKALAANQPQTLTGSLQLTIPNGATGSSAVRLTVRSRLNPTGLVATSADFLAAIGSSPVSSPDIKIVPAVLPRFLDADGRTVLVPTGAGLSVTFNVAVTTSGSYAVAARFDNDPAPAHWHAQVGSPINVTGGPSPLPVAVAVTVDSGAPKSNLFLKVTSQADATQATEVSIPVKEKP